MDDYPRWDGEIAYTVKTEQTKCLLRAVQKKKLVVNRVDPQWIYEISVTEIYSNFC